MPSGWKRKKGQGRTRKKSKQIKYFQWLWIYQLNIKFGNKIIYISFEGY